MSMKNPLTPAGIETATFRFVAQYLNHSATAVPTRQHNKYLLEYIGYMYRPVNRSSSGLHRNKSQVLFRYWDRNIITVVNIQKD